MRKLILKFRIVVAFLRMVRNPKETEQIFALGEALRKGREDEVARAFSHILHDPDFRAMHADRANPRVDLADLRRRPAGSFGRAVAEFLDRNGFEPNTFPMLDSTDPVRFLVSRVRQNHDYWHALTGFGTDVPGELGLQAFTFAQVGALISPIIIAGGLLNLVAKAPGDLPATFDRLAEGYRLGKRCRSLVTFRLEHEWDTDLEALRARLGIADSPAAPSVTPPSPTVAEAPALRA